MFKKLVHGARDAYDIARRASSATELVRAAVPALQQPRVLNDGPAPGMAAPELIRKLRDARNALKGSIPKGRVDYAALRDDAAFADLQRLAPALQRLTPGDLPTDAERTAFFINLYNVLAIHGVIALGIRESVMEIPSFFSVVCYRIGGEALSLDQIENGILRRNGPHPATGKPTLEPGAAAHAFAPSRVDPRIHAALVCASTSCPPVGFYDPERLDEQLDMAAGNYVDSEVSVVQTIELPITFRYYASDWGERRDVEAFLAKHASPTLRVALEKAFARGVPLSYRRYDWSLNVV